MNCRREEGWSAGIRAPKRAVDRRRRCLDHHSGIKAACQSPTQGGTAQGEGGDAAQHDRDAGSPAQWNAKALKRVQYCAAGMLQFPPTLYKQPEECYNYGWQIHCFP